MKPWIVVVAYVSILACADQDDIILRCVLGSDGTLDYVLRLEPSAGRATLLHDPVHIDVHGDSLPLRSGSLEATDAEYRINFPLYVNASALELLRTFPDTPSSAVVLGDQVFTINRYTGGVSTNSRGPGSAMSEWQGTCEPIDPL